MGFLTSAVLLSKLARGFLDGRGPLPEKELVIGVGLDAARAILRILEDAGLVVETEKGYILAKPPERVFLKELVSLFVPPGQENLEGLISRIEISLGETSLMNIANETSSFPSPTP